MPPIFRSILSSSRSIFSAGRPPTLKRRLPLDFSVYVVANRPSYPNENVFFSKIKELVRAGISCVQLRDHKNDFATTLRTASRLKDLLKDTPLFINTLKPFEIALAVDAAGVYLEENYSYTEARRVLGPKAILGIGVKTMAEVIAAEQIPGIDYLSVKVSASKRTCPKNDYLWGLEGLRSVRTISSHRIVAIGGLNVECLEPIYKILHFNDGIAMAGGLMEAENPFLAVQKIRAIRQKVRGEL